MIPRGGPAPVETIPIGVEVERRPGATRWQAVVWRPCALRPGGAGRAPWTLLAEEEGDVARYHAGEAGLVLHRADTKVVKDNLESRSPSVFVVLRRGTSVSGWVLHLVTADPSEAHAHADVGADLVEALPMPPAVYCRAAAFVARHHVERPVWKRKRDRPDLDALSAGRMAAAPARPGAWRARLPAGAAGAAAQPGEDETGPGRPGEAGPARPDGRSPERGQAARRLAGPSHGEGPAGGPAPGRAAPGPGRAEGRSDD